MQIKKIINFLHKLLSPILRWSNFLDEYTKDAGIVDKVYNVVRSYYYFLLFLILLDTPNFFSYISRGNSFLPRGSLFWIWKLDFKEATYAILIMTIVFGFIGAIFSWSRIGRICAFVGVWQFHAFLSSFGQPNHQWYPWVYSAFCSSFYLTIQNQGIHYQTTVEKDSFIFFLLLRH